MSAHTYEESKSIALRIIIILAIVTVVEVFIALLGKGHLISGFAPYDTAFIGSFPIGKAVMYLLMIVMSIYKAYLVIFEFMHMKYEVRNMMRSVLLPAALLIWAIIAFFAEGTYWKNSRAGIEAKDKMEVESSMTPIGPATEESAPAAH